VQVSSIRPLAFKGVPGTFGKSAINGAVLDGALDVDSDQRADLIAHSGFGKAVYLVALYPNPSTHLGTPKRSHLPHAASGLLFS